MGVALGILLSLSPQTPVLIEDPRECDRSCGVEATHLVRLGSAVEEPVALTHATEVTRNGRDGSYVAAPLLNPGELAVFGTDGSFSKTIGEPGEGPQELRQIRHILWLGPDTLLVTQGSRFSIVSVSESSVLASTLLDVQVRDIARLSNGLPIVQYWPIEGGEPRARFHLVDPWNGEVVKGMAAARPPEPRYAYASVQQLGADPNGGVWAASYNEYLLEHWDVDSDRLVRSLRRRVDWFPGWSGELLPPSDDWRRPRIIHVQPDEDGFVWVFAAVPDPDFVWRGLPHEARATDVGPWEIFDTRVEVIDPRTGRVVGTYRFEGYVNSVAASEGGMDLAEMSEDVETGLVVADVWRLRRQ